MSLAKNLRYGLVLFLFLTSITPSFGFTSKKPQNVAFQGAAGVYELSDPKIYSSIYAVSDVHGMSAEIQKALASAKVVDDSGHWIAGTSLLIIVGDSIDKGPDTIGVIDFWRGLAPQASAAGGAVVHLLGNHEAELLANPSSALTPGLAQELQAKNLTVNDLTDPSTPRGNFLRSEPLAGKSETGFFPMQGFTLPCLGLISRRRRFRNFLRGRTAIRSSWVQTRFWKPKDGGRSRPTATRFSRY